MTSPPQVPKPLKIYVHALDGTGHLNASVGMAQALCQRGHRITFLLNAAFKGQFAKFGFEEILLFRTQTQANPEAENPEAEHSDPVKEMAQMLLDSGVMNGQSSLQKLHEGAKGEEDFAEQQFQVSVEFNPQIEAAIQKGRPDVIIVDHFYVPPAVLTAGVPWVLLLSGNPLLTLDNPELPPAFSGYPTKGDRSKWNEFRQLLQDKSLIYYQKYARKLVEQFGAPLTDNVPGPGQLFLRSKYLNVYGYPEELDYSPTVPDKFVRVDAFCRTLSEPFELPAAFRARAPGQKVIYFSLGSMGSIDVQLVKRIATILSRTGHHIVVSKGPLAAQYDLPDHCWGEAHLPQTQLLPLVDLVVTHGGNNTTTEAFAFGKPMIVLPLFGDQYDNGRRVAETGFGVCLEPYMCTEHELTKAVRSLLADESLKQRLIRAAHRIATANSKQRACERIEQLVR